MKVIPHKILLIHPCSFYPDRWTKEAKLHLPRFSYFPFGGGIRGCIGEPFAWMEGILLLATICHRWKMHHDADHDFKDKHLWIKKATGLGVTDFLCKVPSLEACYS
jgi:cytochrome P450